MVDDDLSRFVDAQSQVYARVVEELKQGRKQSHWMWFIFPQVAGLGHSTAAQHYAIISLDHARRYLDHPILGARLRETVNLMLSHRDKTAHEILGSPDDLKFHSSLTLFGEAAANASDRKLFAAALHQFYGGGPDPRTLQILQHA